MKVYSLLTIQQHGHGVGGNRHRSSRTASFSSVFDPEANTDQCGGSGGAREGRESMYK